MSFFRKGCVWGVWIERRSGGFVMGEEDFLVVRMILLIKLFLFWLGVRFGIVRGFWFDVEV